MCNQPRKANADHSDISQMSGNAISRAVENEMGPMLSGRMEWVSIFLFCNKAASSVVTAIIMVVVVGESRSDLTGPPSTKGSSGVHQHTQLTMVERTKRRISFNHQGYLRNNQQEHEAIDVGIQLHRCNVQGAICQSKWCSHLLSIIWFLQYL